MQEPFLEADNQDDLLLQAAAMSALAAFIADMPEQPRNQDRWWLAALPYDRDLHAPWPTGGLAWSEAELPR